MISNKRKRLYPKVIVYTAVQKSEENPKLEIYSHGIFSKAIIGQLPTEKRLSMTGRYPCMACMHALKSTLADNSPC